MAVISSAQKVEQINEYNYSQAQVKYNKNWHEWNDSEMSEKQRSVVSTGDISPEIDQVNAD